jgi:site-specific DNA recombinase
VPVAQDHLVKLLAKGRLWWGEMLEHNLTGTELAARHGVTKTYVSRVVRLNFLAPRIVEAILTGQHLANLDAKRLLTMHDLPLAWSKQEKAILY